MSRVILPRRFRQSQGGFIMHPFAHAAPGGAVTWDASAMGPNIVLSASDMVAEKTATAYESVYATVGHATGKWQVEMKHLALTGSNGPGFGLADKTNLANQKQYLVGLNTAPIQESIGWRVDGLLYRRTAVSSGVAAHGSASAVNDIITITLDLSLGSPEVRFYKNGVALGAATVVPSGKTWYPVTSVRSAGKTQLIANTLTYPVSGFTDWG